MAGDGDRKSEIIGAAVEVFADRGYEAGSMRQIAARVGVSEPALYRHFPGKEALFLGIITLVAGTLRREAEGLIGDLRPQALREQLTAAFADRRRAVRTYAPVLRTVFATVAHNPRFLDALRAELVGPVTRRLAEKATELDAAFEVPDAEMTRAARVRSLMAMFVGYFVSSIVIGDEVDDYIAEVCIRIMGWERTGQPGHR